VGLAFLTVFAPAVLIGAVFPLVTAAYSTSVAALGRSVGRVYAVNTLGSIIGSIAPVVFIVGWLGIQGGVVAIALVNFVLGALIVLIVALRRTPRRALASAGALAVMFLAAWSVMRGT